MTSKGFDPNIDLPINMKVRCTRKTDDEADPICGQVYLRNIGNEQQVEFPRDQAIRDRCPKCGSAEWNHLVRIEPRGYKSKIGKTVVHTPTHSVVGKG